MTTPIEPLGGLSVSREKTRKVLAFWALASYFFLILFIVFMSYFRPFVDDRSIGNQSISNLSVPISTTTAIANVPTSSTAATTKPTLTSTTAATPTLAVTLNGSQEKNNFDKTIQLLTTVAGILGGIVGTIFGFYFREEKE